MHLFFTFGTYLYLQIKRAVHKLPVLLCGIFLLIGMIGVIAYCSISIYAHSMEQGLLNDKLSVDLVIQDATQETSLALQFVENMESTKDILSFRTVSLEEAYHDLDTHKAIAVMVLPSGVLQSILDGTNQSIQIIFPATSDLSTLVIRELTNSGAIMLDAAQSGIYTLADLYIAENLHSYLEESFQKLNQINLSYALARERLFTMKSTSALGNSSVLTYYASSAAWLILMLFGILCAPFLSRESVCFTDKIRQAGLSTPLLVLSKWFTTFCVYTVICIPLLGICHFVLPDELSIPITTSFLGTFFLFMAFISAYVVLFYEITPNTATGILCITICSIVLLFLSGAFIPIAFFPDSLKVLSRILPTTYGLRSLSLILSDQPVELSALYPIMGYTLLCFSLSCIKIRKKTM